MTDTDTPIRVLHVDDEPDFLELAAEMLEREDDRFVVETATSVTNGFAKLTDTDYDCVVSDYDMPGENGLEFLEMVRDEYPDLPFVLYTGKGSEEVASDAISAGVTDYLQKERGTRQYEVLAHRISNAVERHAAERERRQWKRAVETATEGIAILDEDGRYLQMNEAYAEAYGMTRAELLGQTSRAVYPDEVAEWFEEEVRPRLRRAGTWKGDAVARRADGTQFHQRLSLATLDDGGHVCVMEDVTERKRREHELEQTNTVVQTILEALPIGVLIEDAERDILMANETLCEVLNLSVPADDLIGRDCATAAAEIKAVFDDSEGFVNGIEEHIEHRKPVRGEELALADGRTVERDYVPFTLPEGMANLWLYRDITERKEREEALSALHTATQEFMQAPDKQTIADVAVATARTALDQPICGLWLHDADANVLRPAAVTDEGEELLGDPPLYTEGEGLSWQTFVDGELRVYDDVTTQPDPLNPDTPLRSEMIIPLGDHGVMNLGATQPADFSAIDISLARVLGNTVEAALSRADREQQLRSQRAELERQNERLEQFASVVSHDLRNPLDVATGRTELARQECDSEHLDVVARAHDRIEALIDDLLTIAREGNRVGDPESVTLADAVERCWRTVETADAAVVTTTDQSIRADPSRLRQLLENLFRNAIEHGGEDVTVTVGALGDGDGFYVADDGPGIPETDYEAVFDAGYSTTEEGTGFGLNIVQEIAEAHGWGVTVTESETGGARFEITGVETTTG